MLLPELCKWTVSDSFKLDNHLYASFHKRTFSIWGDIRYHHGGIDLSIGSIVAVAGVVAALLASQPDLPLIVPILGGLLAGLFIGFINGIIITKSKIAPFIVTLGIMTIGRGLALILSKGRPISNLSDSFNFIGRRHFLNSVSDNNFNYNIYY